MTADKTPSPEELARDCVADLDADINTIPGNLDWEEAEARVLTAISTALKAKEAQITALRTALEWALSRLDVDGGMTPKEQRTTVARLRAALSTTKEGE